MWASCCNWLCMESLGVDEDSAGSERRGQSYTNSGYSSHPSPPPLEHTCKACGGRFDAQVRKHVCADCKKNYCSHCSAHQEPRPRLCHTCQRFYGNLLERAELMKLKVKELRDYLHLHEVSTHLCREKEELVELVLSQQSSPSSTYTPDNPISNFPNGASDSPDVNPNISPVSLDPVPPDLGSDVSVVQPEPPAPSSEAVLSQVDAHDEEEAMDAEEVHLSGRRASLSDLSCLEDIEMLSVRQLKEILARNFVNYKGCCEKWELMERVTRLYQEQQKLAASTIDASVAEGGPGRLEEHLCKICMDSPIDCVLLECGHMITCTKCGKRMSECPICRQYVVRAVHVFRS
ncbi:E3 ubiquitin-protein ligase rififylin [Thalassophryne amazonica]|uniref:E3 ubiquitin-protein ligase rififylin n=1 Tax=Thalassophryne amazonica TaxID=390379 RepID=UPI0014724BEE|nr:E3 ubiquitin-protein ligase rififylin [Thalassophryne amazonica]XP_034024591.1 E3 ubiquitin-protein ligase rififylin [Thalassophryne amazonica]